MTEENNRRLVVDLPIGIYPEQGYHDVSQERINDLTLLLYTNSQDVGSYGFQLVGGSFFNFRGDPVSMTIGESLCGEPDDFPQLRYRSFEEGFSALVEELKEGNGNLELYLKPGVLKSLEGITRLCGVVREVPPHLFGEEGHEEIQRDLGLETLNPPRLDISNTDLWYNSLSDEQRVEIIKNGIHYWCSLRTIARSLSNDSMKIARLIADKSRTSQD